MGGIYASEGAPSSSGLRRASAHPDTIHLGRNQPAISTWSGSPTSRVCPTAFDRPPASKLTPSCRCDFLAEIGAGCTVFGLLFQVRLLSLCMLHLPFLTMLFFAGYRPLGSCSCSTELCLRSETSVPPSFALVLHSAASPKTDSHPLHCRTEDPLPGRRYVPDRTRADGSVLCAEGQIARDCCVLWRARARVRLKGASFLSFSHLSQARTVERALWTFRSLETSGRLLESSWRRSVSSTSSGPSPFSLCPSLPLLLTSCRPSFRDFFPTILSFLRQLPIIGTLLSLPYIRGVRLPLRCPLLRIVPPSPS